MYLESRGIVLSISVGNRKGKSLSIIGKLLPIDYRLIIENPSIALKVVLESFTHANTTLGCGVRHKIENLVIALKRETTGSRLGYGRCRGGLGVRVKGVAGKEGVG